jgi:hypothetical protein
VTNTVGWLLKSRANRERFRFGDFMPRFAQVLLVAMLALVAGEPASAQDRTTNCRPLAERGRVWVDCCNQSFARNPTRAISPRARLRGIERCVRNRLRHA